MPVSTSTPAPPSSPSPVPTPTKIAVVVRPQPLTAVRIVSPQDVPLADGRVLAALPGDWLICRGRQQIDVVGDGILRERYQVVETGAVTLSLADVTRLEETLGVGNAQSTTRLLPAVERLAKIEIGHIRIEFTPGQLEEIALRAKKRNQTIAQAIQSVIDRIREEIFWKA